MINEKIDNPGDQLNKNGNQGLNEITKLQLRNLIDNRLILNNFLVLFYVLLFVFGRNIRDLTKQIYKSHFTQSKQSNSGEENGYSAEEIGYLQYFDIPQGLLDTLSEYVDAPIDITFSQMMKSKGYNLSNDTLYLDKYIFSHFASNRSIETGIATKDLLPIINQKIRNTDYQGTLQDISNQYLKIFTDDYYNSQQALYTINSIIFEPGKQYTYGEKITSIIRFIGNPSRYGNLSRETINFKGLTFNSDYNVPGVLVPFLGGDCNSIVGLFVQLCRINNIPSAIGVTDSHAYAYIGVKESDMTAAKKIPDRLLFNNNKQIGSPDGTRLSFIPVEPSTGGEWTNGKLNAYGKNDGFAIFWPK